MSCSKRVKSGLSISMFCLFRFGARPTGRSMGRVAGIFGWFMGWSSPVLGPHTFFRYATVRYRLGAADPKSEVAWWRNLDTKNKRVHAWCVWCMFQNTNTIRWSASPWCEWGRQTQIPEKSASNFEEKSDDRILKCTLLLKILNYCEKIIEFDIYGITIEFCTRSFKFRGWS